MYARCLTLRRLSHVRAVSHGVDMADLQSLTRLVPSMQAIGGLFTRALSTKLLCHGSAGTASNSCRPTDGRSGLKAYELSQSHTICSNDGEFWKPAAGRLIATRPRHNDTRSDASVCAALQHQQIHPCGALRRGLVKVHDVGRLISLPSATSRHFASALEAASTDVDDSVECVVIGAGVIGLAVARALALRGREVVLLEAHGAIGSETSSRHSEVIHAGIYYPLGSLKARMCVEGKMRLYDFCRTHNVPHKNITKLIVATSKDQLPDLVTFQATASRHGVPDLQLLSGREARGLEPALACEGALLSPSTGILDSHSYMAALLADAEAHGVVTALNTRVVGGRVEEAAPTSAASGAATAAAPVPYKVLEVHSLAPPGSGDGGGDGAKVVEVSRLRARWVVNAGGLHAVRVAAGIAGLPRSSIPRLHLAKGNYFSLAGRCPFSRLIYPLPEKGLAGLGTHLTLDMGGGAKFGPDVEWLPDPGPDPAAPVVVDYKVDAHRAQSFYPAIRRYFPGLPDDALQPSYSGVRPKLSGPGEAAADFLVQGARQGHGVRGWVNLYGIESPGLTSSLALAEYVCGVLEGEDGVSVC